MASVRLFSGKGEFVRRKLPDGGIEKVCLCVHNTDFLRGCISQVRVDLLPEVIEHNGRYAPDKLKEYYKLGIADNRCMYCYASRLNGGRVTPEKVDNVTESYFRELKLGIIRIGKRTESGHVFYFPVLRDFLELCRKYGAEIILPTKALSFGREGLEHLQIDDRLPNLPVGKEIAGIFKQVGGVINYSIGNDRLEPGMVSQGHTNAWRIEQARLYREAGVNTTLTITCDVTSSIEDNASRGFAVKQALEAGKKFEIPIRILPLRISSHKLAVLATGKSWDEIKHIQERHHPKQTALFEMHQVQGKPYQAKGNNELIPRFLHPDFQQLVDSGTGLCGIVGDYENCDKCTLENRRIRFPVSQLAEVEYNNKGKRRRLGLRGPKLF